MFGWIGAALGIVNKLLSAVGWFQKRSDEDRMEEVGATKQKVADLEKAVAVKDAQLAAAAKPKASREELLAKAKGRKRT